jgi:subtilisin-like proprotein convertase family protein
VKRKKLWFSSISVVSLLLVAALIATTAGAGTGGRLFFFQNAKRPIPDAPNGGGVLDKLSLRGNGRIRDLNIGIRINHDADADLNIYLVSPKGKFVELSTDNGGGGNNYGTGANNCPNARRYTVFTDEAGRSIRQGTAPFAGSFRPQTPLSALDGDRIGGTWRLMVLDDDAGASGTIGCFTMGVLLR